MYERIRPLVLFGDPVPERATETGTSERTPYRRIAGFELDGMRSLIVDLKALELEEYAARSRNKPETLQGALFSYLEAL